MVKPMKGNSWVLTRLCGLFFTSQYAWKSKKGIQRSIEVC